MLNHSCPFSKYKNLLGIPNEGVHKYRFLNTAIVDYTLAILLAMTISYFTGVTLELTTIYTLGFGVMLHVLFGVETNTTKYLGMKCDVNVD